MKGYTRQWVRKAESDIAVARHLFKLRPLPSDEICFHCQQAIEKYFKSLLAESGLPIQKTHDLTILIQRHDDHLAAGVGHYDSRLRIGEDLFDQLWQVAFGIFQSHSLHVKSPIFIYSTESLYPLPGNVRM